MTELTDTAVLLGLAVDPGDAVARSQAEHHGAAEPDAAASRGRTRSRALSACLRAVPPLASERAAPGRARRADERRAKAQLRWYARPVVAITVRRGRRAAHRRADLGTNVAIQGANAASRRTRSPRSIRRPTFSARPRIVSTGGTATLVWSTALGKSALIGKGLKALPSGKTYELWYISAAGKADVGRAVRVERQEHAAGAERATGEGRHGRSHRRAGRRIEGPDHQAHRRDRVRRRPSTAPVSGPMAIGPTTAFGLSGPATYPNLPET